MNSRPEIILALAALLAVTGTANASQVSEPEPNVLEVNDRPIETTSKVASSLEPEPIPEATYDAPTDAITDTAETKAEPIYTPKKSKSVNQGVPQTSNGFKSQGVIRTDDYRYTWYSDKEPGQTVTAWEIPGKHVGSDGIYRDKDGYICVAANIETAGKYEVVDTPFGKGKVYDTGCNAGVIDIYTSF